MSASGEKGSQTLTREEVAKHNTTEDQWIIVEDKVYDISKWYLKHPGGKVITFYRGEDATEPMRAFHPDMERTGKFMKVLEIGKLSPESYNNMNKVVKEFRTLRSDLEKEGRFQSSASFYVVHLLHLIILEILPVVLLYNYGVNAWTFFLASIILATSQAQAGWNQHDFGHLAVFYKNRDLNQLWHHITIGVLKGASSRWWKARHNRHHAKTNVVKHDPDIHTEPYFVWGESMIKNGWQYLPYQHLYWWIIGPPAVTTFLFVMQNLKYVFLNRLWSDFLSVVLFFVRFGVTYTYFMSFGKVVFLYFLMRLWETHWFTWVTSMSHLPRPIKVERESQNWVAMHAMATQNIIGGPFHDWFTGHLNYQLEHHLFPTMPRHQLPFVAERVKKLCESNGLPYHVKSMYECCCDIMEKLRVVAVAWKKHKDLKNN